MQWTVDCISTGFQVTHRLLEVTFLSLSTSLKAC